MDYETTEQVMNDHTGLRLADTGQYDLFPALAEDQPTTVRDGIQYPRPTRQEWLDRAEARLQDILDSASKVRVRLYIGELSAEIGEFDTRQGSADLAALLRQVAGRLDP